MLQRIMRGEWHLPSRPTTSKGVQEIITGLIQQDPAKRMTIEDIYSHPWFNIHLPDGVKQLNQNAASVDPAQGLDHIKSLVEEARSIPG